MQQRFWQALPTQPALFHDRAYRRGVLPEWDERWDRLSVPARRLFLEQIPCEPRAAGIPRTSLPAQPLTELLEAGLVGSTPPAGDRIAQHPEALDFATRLRTLRRFRLLDPDRGHQLDLFVQTAFSHYLLSQELSRVLEAQRIRTQFPRSELAQVFVTNRRWPRWVARFIGHPLAGALLDLLEQTPRVPLTRLPEQLLQPPEAVRPALEGLIVLLGVFEDLDPTTLELQVGLLPAVRAGLEQALHPRPRPPLIPSVPTASATPEAGTVLPDLSTLLVELAGSPARLRQGGGLFQKDLTRLEPALEPLPDWYAEQSSADRIQTASWIGHGLGLLRVREGGNRTELTPTEAAGEWLTLDPEQQFQSVVRYLARERPDSWQSGGFAFLGCSVSVSVEPESWDRTPILSGAQAGWESCPTTERQPGLRDAIDQALQELPCGPFVSWEVFLERVSVDAHNFLLLGRPLEQVEIRHENILLPPSEERVEKLARQVLTTFLHTRLLPFGCVRAALDADNRLLVTRTPRLDIWFGRLPCAGSQPPTAAANRVIVQPDFSVVLIGSNPTPAAELSPFCERVVGTEASGAVTYRITWTSVVKGVAAGLAPAEILARLERHATIALPANVVQEIEEWCARIRTVTTEPATLIRCPDRASADRVQSILGPEVERLNETTLACPEAGLDRARRQKLLGHGILIHEPAPAHSRSNEPSREKAL
jgi:hypothetical protein